MLTRIFIKACIFLMIALFLTFWGGRFFDMNSGVRIILTLLLYLFAGLRFFEWYQLRSENKFYEEDQSEQNKTIL